MKDRLTAPGSFRWRGRRRLVAEVLECWRDNGAWWRGEPPTLFLRVLTRDGGIWELCRKAAGGDWEVYKRYD